ncbi:MAG: HlyD family efflux transporter periplasmic adaptor subunit [Lachnospiraceae bacterium]|nr:HlyD family efflux transporter periplasmic adaptor subunit [Lachnospiraceae bacterium]
MKKKKKWIVIAIVGILLAALIGAGLWFFLGRDGQESQSRSDRNFGQRGSFISDGITAYGVTSIGISRVEFEVENLSTGLEISKVFISSGEQVQEGTAILELTQESVQEAREELEQVLLEAELAYRAGAIEYEQSLITAEYDRDLALVKSDQAREVYDETLEGLTGKLEKAQEELSDAQEKIAEYHSYVDNDTYRSYFEVDKYQKLYDENLQLLKDGMDRWGIGWSQVTGGTRPGENNQYVIVLSGLYKVLEQNLKDLESAQDAYEDAVANASFELQTLELQLPELEQAVLDAKEDYEAQSLSAKVTYETTLNNGTYAEKNYEAAVEKAQADYDLLQDAYEDAKVNLELFESGVGDGQFYATQNGSILRVMVRAGQNLTSGATVFTYSNPEEMTVTVSVDQSLIADITVGDKAYVNGTYEGVVSEINPISEAESYTDVTYDVIVTLSGDLGDLTSNETVMVTFGGLKLNIPSSDGTPGEGQRPEDMEFPEGMERPGGNGGRGGDRGQKKEGSVEDAQ